jgi:hypothetical protein
MIFHPGSFLQSRRHFAGRKLSVNLFLGLFFMAVLANVCYCAVYIADLFVQFSGLHTAWAKGRVFIEHLRRRLVGLGITGARGIVGR